MVDQLQEEPPSFRIEREARRRINDMFTEYRQRYVDCWEPRPCPSREEFK